MARDRQPAGICEKCGADTIQCSYNLFHRDDLRIDTWEHRCTNCSLRLTTGYRSDDEDEDVEDPTICPYCGRQGQSK
jgi:hypothetical protein